MKLLRSNSLKKALLFVLLVLSLFSSFFVASGQNQTKAADTPSDASSLNITETVTPDSSAKTYNYSVRVLKDSKTNKGTLETNGFFAIMIESGNELLFGTESAPVVDEATGKQLTTASGEPLYAQVPGALDSVFALNGQMYANPPASGITYAQQEWKQLTTGNKAYAAEDSWIYYPGLGYTVLRPIQDYWVISRNLAYTVMILIIIIVALMIIFQGYFGGQTQVTIANSLPNIIVALLMITLSYALSGFAIDVITVGINLTQQVLVQNEFSPGYELWNTTSLTDNTFNPLQLPDATLNQQLENIDPDIEIGDYNLNLTEYENIIGDEQNPLKNHLQPDDQAMSIWSIFGTSNIQLDENEVALANLVPNTNSHVIEAVKDLIEAAQKASGAGGLITKLFGLVLGISAFMAALKLFLKLLSKYIILALYPIISPFIMLTIAIPGMGMKSVASYFKTLFAAAITFIMVYAVFLFMLVLTTDTKFTFGFDYTPSLIGYDFNTIGDTQDGAVVTGAFIKNLIAYGLFVSTPVIPDFVEKLLLTPAQFRSDVAGRVFQGQALAQTSAGLRRFNQGRRAITSRFTPEGPEKKS